MEGADLGMEIEDEYKIRVKGCVMVCNTSKDNLPDAGCNKLPTFVAVDSAMVTL